MTNPKLNAMVPVDSAMARSKTSKANPHGWEMSEANLFQGLIERTRGRAILADEIVKKLWKTVVTTKPSFIEYTPGIIPAITTPST